MGELAKVGRSQLSAAHPGVGAGRRQRCLVLGRLAVVRVRVQLGVLVGMATELVVVARVAGVEMVTEMDEAEAGVGAEAAAEAAGPW